MGILLYKMLYSKTPFSTSYDAQVGHVKFTEDEAFLNVLCQRIVRDYQTLTIQDIKSALNPSDRGHTHATDSD